MEVEHITIPTDPTHIQTHYGNSLIEDNRSLFFKIYPRKDSALADILFHMVIGQLPNIRNLRYTIRGSSQDMRLHCSILSPSGTQKGAAYSYQAQLCSQLSLKFKPMGLFTDSGLVGYPDGKNTTGRRARPRTNPNNPPTATTDDEPPAYEGDLSREAGHNILAWSEGTDVFDVKKFGYNQHTMNILQKAMNPIDSHDNIIEKTTGLGTITVKPVCSLLFTTYPPITLTTEVLGTGFMQRQITLIRDLELSQREQTALDSASNINTKLPEKDFASIIYRLKVINKFSETAHITVPKEIEPHIRTLISRFWTHVYSKNIIAQPKLGEFASRWSSNILYTTIFHHTLCRLSTTVSYEDIIYAESLLLPIWHDLCDFIEGVLKQDTPEYKLIVSDIHLILDTYLASPLKPAPEHLLIDILSSCWRISPGGALKRLRRYEQFLFTYQDTPDIPSELIEMIHPTELELMQDSFTTTRYLTLKTQIGDIY